MDELRSFISQRRITGETDQDIASELLGAGWDREMVRAALEQMPAAVPPQPPQVEEPIIAPGPGYPQPVQPAGPSGGFFESPKKMISMIDKKLVVIGLVMLACLLFIVWLIVVLSSNANPSTPTGSAGITESQALELRDTERRGDISRIYAEIETTAALNNGRIPTASQDTWEQLISNYKDFADPLSGDEYVFTTSVPQVGEIQFANRVLCNEDQLVPALESDAAVRTLLESGEIYCIDGN